MSSLLSPPLQQQLVNAIRQRLPHCLGIYVFGSQARGDANATSDLDMAVLVEGKLTALETWELAHQLADLLPCPLDLLDLRSASTVLQFQILTEGRRLWGQDPAAGVYEAFAVTDYLHLQERRQAQLAEIEQRGSIYGR